MRDSHIVVQSVVHAAPLPEPLAQMIVAKEAGNPFFLGELARTVVEQDAQAAPLRIPDTVQAVLAARIDRLPFEAKRLLQMAAVIGREVPFTLLHTVTALPIDALSMRLRHLQAAEFLYETPLAPDLIYTFKHALTHEVAYQSLLKSTRQHYHQRVAQVLAACFPEAAETQSELLAHHYTKAGLAEQAVEYWQRAGEHSHARSAYAEAIRHFTKGLELLKSLPDSPERTQQELTLRLALGVPLMATKGFATPDVEKTYVRAQELCQQAGETSRLFSVLSGLWACYEVRGQLETVRELAGQLLTLAERLQDPALILESHRVLGDTLYLLEEFAPARMHLEQGMALYDPQQHRTHAFLYGCDPGVFCTPLLA